MPAFRFRVWGPVLALCLSLSRPILAQPAKSLASFGAYAGLKKASWGFAMRSLRTGKILLTRDGYRCLAPASTLKVVTTATALRQLGPTYTVSTVLAYTGTVLDGTLKGDLLIIGAGDPSLGSGRFGPSSEPDAVLRRWVAKVQAAGIRKVEGRLLVSALAFDEPSVPDGWQNQDLANYFGAPVCGLNWRENLYRLPFRTGGPGTQAKPGTPDPEVPDYRFTTDVKVGGEGSPDLAYIYAGPDGQQRIVLGSLPPHKTAYAVKGALADPAQALARELETALSVKGVDITGAATSVHIWSAEADKALFEPGRQRIVLDSLPSPTLAELAAKTNIHSLNLYAESLLRWTGAKLKAGTSTAAATQAMADYWVGKGLDAEGLFLADGSGLSLSNGITPLHFTDILANMADSTPIGKAFLGSFAVMGRTGTVAEMGRGTKAEGRVRVKSGTLTRVLCYTGYATTRTGEPVAFSLMVNRYSGPFGDMKKQVEKLLVGLCE